MTAMVNATLTRRNPLIEAARHPDQSRPAGPSLENDAKLQKSAFRLL
jgi:hypothetical protein